MNAAAIVEFVTTNESLILVSSVVSAIFCTLLVYRALLYRDPMAARIASLNHRQRTLKSGMLAPKSRQRREQSLGFMRDMVQKFNLLRTQEAKKMSVLLARAGYRDKDALVIFFFMKLALPFAFGAVAIFYIYVLKLGGLTEVSRVLVACGAVMLGAYAPNIYIKNTIKKREVALRKGMPDALDLLIICAEAGQSLDSALKRVARELGTFTPEIADELTLTSIELGLMQDRRVALDNLVQRAAIPEVKNVVNSLIQTEKYGTPLAQSLRVLSAEYRQDRMMKAEEKAARLPAIMTVPLIIFILPPLFVVLLGSAVLRIIDLLVKF